MVVPTIALSELQALITKGHEYVLIDVREPWECEQYGMIPTSKNIPLRDVPHALTLSLQQSKEKYGIPFTATTRLIFSCRSGNRSAHATAFAISKGFHAENFAGSVLAWSKVDSNVKAY